jgi:hypothetical protein
MPPGATTGGQSSSAGSAPTALPPEIPPQRRAAFISVDTRGLLVSGDGCSLPALYHYLAPGTLMRDHDRERDRRFAPHRRARTNDTRQATRAEGRCYRPGLNAGRGLRDASLIAPEKALMLLCGGLQTRRRKPVIHLYCGFDLPNSPQKSLASPAGRERVRLFFEQLRLGGQTLVEGLLA